MTNVKIGRVKSKAPKYFGEPNEKWARGGGRHGYGRHYGKNKNGVAIDSRSKKEKILVVVFREHCEDIDTSLGGPLDYAQGM